jgi:phospholipase/carboxylesterase
MTVFRLLPRDGSAPKALVFVLHGVGADAASMQTLARVLHEANPTAAVVTPDAPWTFDLGGGGYQWFSILGVDDHNRQTRIADAMPGLEAMIEQELAHHHLGRKDLGICGFSQGAMMALALADRANAPAAIASIAGRIARLIAPASASSPHVFITHGDSDPIVPFECLNQSLNAFTEADYVVEAMPIAGLGHQIAPTQADIVGAFFRRTLRSAQTERGASSR